MKGKRIMMILLIVIGCAVLIEVLALLKMKYSVSSYKKYWESGNSAQVDQTKLLYIALGDSAAQSVGASRPQKGYVGLVADSLAVKNSKETQTINLSVSGAKIKDVTDVQIPRLKDYTIDGKTVITLDIGGNEMRSYNAETFRADMDELFAKLPQQTVVADVPYFGGGRYRQLEPNVKDANIIVHELAKKHGLKIVQLHEVTQERSNVLVNSADLFHPSNAGYRNWADAFNSVL